MKHPVLAVLALCCALSVAYAPAVGAKAMNKSALPPSPLPTVGQEAERTMFAQSIEDLPVMKGLEIVEDKDLLFIFGKERIAQTTLKGRVDIDDVYYFYQKVLPPLGWKQVNMRLYTRRGEDLHLDASSANSDGITYVKFEVVPDSSLSKSQKK